MKKLHLFAHMDRNYVKKGDKVVAYKTPIGTIGDGNGQYWAHLHHSISEGLPISKSQLFGKKDDLYHYVSGWSKEKVKGYYTNPLSYGVNYDKMFSRNVDEGTRGYGWVDWVGYGYHPGMDINSFSGGHTDFGLKFTSSCTGTVVYEWRGWTKNGGWGNLIIIEEDEEQTPEPECTHCCPKHC